MEQQERVGGNYDLNEWITATEQDNEFSVLDFIQQTFGEGYIADIQITHVTYKSLSLYIHYGQSHAIINFYQGMFEDFMTARVDGTIPKSLMDIRDFARALLDATQIAEQWNEAQSAIDTATETPPAQRYVVEQYEQSSAWRVYDNVAKDYHSTEHYNHWYNDQAEAEAEAKRLNGEGAE